MSLPKVVNVDDKLTRFREHWAPKIVAQMNDTQVKVVKVRGEFVWHSHSDTDELFLVLAGELRIDFRDGAVRLQAGELCVVPSGVEHRPYAEEECHLLLLEPAGTVNTGDQGETGTVGEWI